MRNRGPGAAGAEVVILTTRHLVGEAPQPVYLARALAERGLRVLLISRAPRHICAALTRSGIPTISTASSVPHTGLAITLATSIRHLLQCRVAVSFELETLNAVAAATPLRRFTRVLYALEMFDQESTRRSRATTYMGYRALRSVVPPDVLVDVCPERLEYSRPQCRDPRRSFVVRNVPPKQSWDLPAPQRRQCRPRLVYAGDFLEHGRAGLDLLIRGMAAAKHDFDLTIYPVRSEPGESETFMSFVARHGMERRVTLGPTVNREHLPTVLSTHDIGVVFYPTTPDQPINNVLAAPNKLSEYLAAGLAVLATSNQTLQFVGHERLGWNLRQDAAEDVTAVLDEIAANRRQDVDERRQRAHAAFHDRYHYESQAEPLLDCIQKAVRGPAADSRTA